MDAEFHQQLERIAILQQLHRVLRKTHRYIVENVEHSLIVIMMKVKCSIHLYRASAPRKLESIS